MKHFTSTLMVVLIALLMFAGRYLDVSPVETLRLKTFDYYQKIKPRTKNTDSVVIVEITEDDLKTYGQWPWPRNIMADLHNKIQAQQVQSIQYNILFTEADRLNELSLLKGDVSNDQLFAGTIRGSNTVMMYSIKYKPTSSAVAKVGATISGDKPTKHLYNFIGIVSNLPELLQHAKGAGVNIMIPNIDGTVRQIPLYVSSDVGLIPHQIMETLRIKDNSRRYKITADARGINSINVSRNRLIHTDKNGMFRINFAEVGSIKKYSASDLLKNRIIDLKDKIVIVGLNAAGLSYFKDTPIGIMTDAQISAQALETVFTDTQLIRDSNTNWIELSGIFLIGLLLIVVIPRAGVTSSVLVFLTLLTGVITASLHLYSTQNYLLDASFAVVFVTIMWGHLTYNNFATQFRLRQQIKKQFEHYLAPSMVAQLQKNPELLKLGGETREMTFMFSDIRGFTPISEKYKNNPAGLTRLINRFLTRMTDIIIANGGTIDKFMGDCIMAFWNAPLDTPDHAKRAVDTAIKMQKELKLLNAELKKEKLPAINIGIGINTGTALVGNMGSEQRFDYSVIGDDVNLASRLESSSKDLKTTLVIGENTRKQCGKKVKFKSLGTIKVKGKTNNIKVYTL